MRTAYTSKEEVQRKLQENSKTDYHSQFNFLKEHKGHRKGNLHLYLGISGGGKSTLMRSLVIDAAFSIPDDKKVLVWLSEESYDDFTTELYKSGVPEKIYKKILIISEMEDAIFKEEDNKTFFFGWCRENEVEMIFYDNITTSRFYMDRKVIEQAAFCTELKMLASETNKPLIIFSHTDARVTETIDRLVNMNDIRGSKSIVNLTQFMYIMQRFQLENKFYSTIRVTKHRGQPVENNIFLLRYHKQSALYPADQIISFDAFKDAYKKRNKLSGT